jgi:hypothetical protein
MQTPHGLFSASDSQRKAGQFSHPKVLDKKFPVLNIALVNKPIQKGGAPAVDIENLKNMRKL